MFWLDFFTQQVILTYEALFIFVSDSFCVFYSCCRCPSLGHHYLNCCHNDPTHLPDSQTFIFSYLSSHCALIPLLKCFQRLSLAYRRNVSHCSICSRSFTFPWPAYTLLVNSVRSHTAPPRAPPSPSLYPCIGLQWLSPFSEILTIFQGPGQKQIFHMVLSIVMPTTSIITHSRVSRVSS